MSNKTGPIHEIAAAREYWDLSVDPVFRGKGVPQGNGKTVLVLPGLFGNDLYLRPLRQWLSRIGYRPTISSLLINAGCPKRLLGDVEAALERRGDLSNAPIAIIGHSRGGMLGKALASRLGDKCDCFIALGSPVGGILSQGFDAAAIKAAANQQQDMAANPVAEASRRALKFFDPDCGAPYCGCDYIQDLVAPFPKACKTYAIYSRDDQIVYPAACPIDEAVNATVGGTHSGLVWNKQVYPLLAAALAEA